MIVDIQIEWKMKEQQLQVNNSGSRINFTVEDFPAPVVPRRRM